MWGWLRRHADKVAFAAGLLLAAFAFGVAVGKFRVFPHDGLQAAFDAADDWRQNWRHHLGVRSNWQSDSDRPGGVSSHDPARAWGGHTFVSLYRGGASGYGGVLIDMQGEVLHEWHLPLAEIWRRAGFAAAPMPDRDAVPHGVQMLRNGDLVMALAGAALVRLDACSRVLWATPVAAHHSVDVLPDGRVWVPVTSVHGKANPSWPRLRPGPAGRFDDQLLALVSPGGEVLEEISVSDVIYGSDWVSLLFVGRGSAYSMAEQDPYHLNDVEELRPEMAGAFPMFEAGDLLVSLRNLQSVVVVDGRTRRIKWAMTGPFFGQHDPDFAANGRVLLFDNRITGDDPQLGYSRVLEIDPATRAVVWAHQGSDADPWYSPIGGRVQLLPNGNVLVTEPKAGRVLELARDGGRGETVWQFVNALDAGAVGMPLDAERLPALDEPWVGRPCA